jgi:hypothetical protein
MEFVSALQRTVGTVWIVPPTSAEDRVASFVPTTENVCLANVNATKDGTDLTAPITVAAFSTFVLTTVNVPMECSFPSIHRDIFDSFRSHTPSIFLYYCGQIPDF